MKFDYKDKPLYILGAETVIADGEIDSLVKIVTQALPNQFLSVKRGQRIRPNADIVKGPKHMVPTRKQLKKAQNAKSAWLRNGDNGFDAYARSISKDDSALCLITDRIIISRYMDPMYYLGYAMPNIGFCCATTPEFMNVPDWREQLPSYISSLVLHEVGHLLGLSHHFEESIDGKICPMALGQQIISKTNPKTIRPKTSSKNLGYNRNLSELLEIESFRGKYFCHSCYESLEVPINNLALP